MPAFTDAFEARILIVDDQQSNVRLLEYALRRGGYVAVTSTTDPREVCALQRLEHHDLILLDIQMPCMNGFEVLEGLRNLEGEEMPAVLVLSADPTHMVRALESGARGFLSKPFVLAEVLQRAHSMLDQCRAERRRGLELAAVAAALEATPQRLATRIQ